MCPFQCSMELIDRLKRKTNKSLEQLGMLPKTWELEYMYNLMVRVHVQPDGAANQYVCCQKTRNCYPHIVPSARDALRGKTRHLKCRLQSFFCMLLCHAWLDREMSMLARNTRPEHTHRASLLMQKLEGDLKVIILCYIGPDNKIACTISDLECFICKEKKVSCYDELEMGPLLRHSFVQEYWKPPPTLTAIPQASWSRYI